MCSPASMLGQYVSSHVYKKLSCLNAAMTREGSTQVCALGVSGREKSLGRGQGRFVRKHMGQLFCLWWPMKENWHTKEWLILRIRMSGYMFFCWPGEVPCLPGLTIKLFRDCFSLLYQTLWSLRQCLGVQVNVLGKSCLTMSVKFDLFGTLSFNQFLSLF